MYDRNYWNDIIICRYQKFKFALLFLLEKTQEYSCYLPAKLQFPHILLASAHKGQGHLQTLDKDKWGNYSMFQITFRE